MMHCVCTVLIVLCGFLMFSDAKENQCPGGKANCPDNSTCCVLSNGSFGCCPIQNAICCGDSAHCCPNGYTCDVIKGTCKTGTKLIPLLKKFNSKPIMVPATTKRPDGNISPEKRYQCPKKSTCSKRSSGIYGCCPLNNAVCCDDRKHCCPEGFTCDVDAGKCKKKSEHINMIEEIQALKMSIGKCSKTAAHVNMIENIPATKNSIDSKQKIPALKKKISAASDRQSPPLVCPDGRTYCHFTQTCCPGPHRHGWRCCPYSPAACCSDGVHCCRRGYVCSPPSMGPICIRI